MLPCETSETFFIFAIGVQSNPQSGCFVHMLNYDVLHLIHLQVKKLEKKWHEQAEALCSLTTIRLLVSLRGT